MRENQRARQKKMRENWPGRTLLHSDRLNVAKQVCVCIAKFKMIIECWNKQQINKKRKASICYGIAVCKINVRAQVWHLILPVKEKKTGFWRLLRVLSCQLVGRRSYFVNEMNKKNECVNRTYQTPKKKKNKKQTASDLTVKWNVNELKGSHTQS